MYRVTLRSFGCTLPAMAICIASGVTLTSLPVAAEPCADGAQACPAAAPSHLGDRFANDISLPRVDSRLADKPWLSQDVSESPALSGAAEASLKLQASTIDWSSFANRKLTRQIEEATRLAQQPLVLPKAPPRQSTGLDVWSSLDIQRSEAEGERAQRGAVGADYKLSRTMIVGAVAGFRDEDLAAAGGGDDQTIAAYFALRPDPRVSLHLRAEHGATAAAAAGDANDTQSVASARVTGGLDIGRLKFAPSLTVATGSEHATVAGREIRNDKASVEIAPRLSRPFAMEKGRRLEPFVAVKGRVEVDSGPASSGRETTRGIAGGVTLVQPNAYDLSVTTEIEARGDAPEPEVKSRLQLKLPLR